MDRGQATKRAEELVSKMTLEEAASQLRYDSPAIDRLGIPEYNWLSFPANALPTLNASSETNRQNDFLITKHPPENQNIFVLEAIMSVTIMAFTIPGR